VSGAVQFGVSRPTLRESVRILETESLINVRRGIGMLMSMMRGRELALNGRAASVHIVD
jgi:DNA-binding FadR family transcriptional regulator